MLRDLADLAGITLVLAMIVGGIQLLEWGLAADQTEPPEVDSVEIPNPVDVRVQGAGMLRPRRARALAAERRLAAEPKREPAE